MPRYKVIIEYVGKDKVGWQRQNNGISVQEIIENAVFSFSKQLVICYAAGRTDSGVNAKGQVVHFDLNADFAKESLIPTKIMSSLNHFMKDHQVSVLSCQQVTLDFHARFSAISRHYVYKIINRPGLLAIDRERAWHIIKELDINAMQFAANFLIGKHDFTSFRATSCQSKSPIKRLTKIDIVKNNDEINLYFSAPSFLHHMVRNIVGTLVDIGLKKYPADDIKHILEKKNRVAAGPTAPPYGLYFLNVDY